MHISAESINANSKVKIIPGDKVRLETKIIRRKGPVGVGEAVASVDGKVVVSAELTFMKLDKQKQHRSVKEDD